MKIISFQRRERRSLHSLKILIVVLLLYSLLAYMIHINIFESIIKYNNMIITGNRTDLNDSDPLDVGKLRTLILPYSKLCKDDTLFYIIVHSKPNNFEQRRVIRSTWGQLKRIRSKNDSENWSIKLIFVLGESSHKLDVIQKNVRDLVKTEAKLYGDILQVNFRDKYRNLIYKHTFAMKWAYEQCPRAKFIVKADDDAFIDVFGLYTYLERTLGPLSKNMIKRTLAGNVFPESTTPQRRGKWAVTRREYPYNTYPSYLGGLAYLMSPDVARDVSEAAIAMPGRPLWIDDVYLTGIVAKSLNLHPIHMNARYIYNHEEVATWTLESSQNSSLPFTFAHLNTSHTNWKNVMKNLWKRASNNYYKTRNLRTVF